MKRLLSLLIVFTLILGAAPAFGAAETPPEGGYIAVSGDLYGQTVAEPGEAKALFEQLSAEYDALKNPPLVSPRFRSAGFEEPRERLVDEDVLGLLNGAENTEPEFNDIYAASEYILCKALDNTEFVNKNGQDILTLEFTYNGAATAARFRTMYELVYMYFPHWYSYAAGYYEGTRAVVFKIAISEPDVVEAEREAASELAEELLAGLDPNSADPGPDFFKALHDWLCENNEYDTKADYQGQYAYTALVTGQTVCAGYANAFALTSYYAQFDVASYCGTATGGEPHRWNVAELGGVKKLIDVTWDDGKNTWSYDYFLTDTAKSKRVWDGEQDNFYDYLHDNYTPPEVEPITTEYAVFAENNRAAYIDLSYFGDERLVSGITTAAYSADGGLKWKKGEIKSLAKLLNKDTKLWITDSYDTKKRRPAEGASVIKFPKISARPKGNVDRLVVNYQLTADPSGFSYGAWIMATKAGVVPENIESYAITESEDGRTPDYAWWKMSRDGEDLLDYKTKYLVCALPVTEEGQYRPAGKVFKFAVAPYSEPPAVKVDYKKEVIKLKAGQVLFGGSYKELESDGVPLEVNGNVTMKPKMLIVAAGKGVTVSLAEYLAEETTKLTIWKLATARKPMSDTGDVWLAARAVLDTKTLNASGGKLTLDAKYEVFGGIKWGKLPKLSAAQTFDIRLKSTVKSGRDGVSGSAASFAGKLEVAYGEWKLGKLGITAATITGLTKLG
ncbi:hypothetical protein FACS18949_03910 [Clostridia bacterium]|nr:hypothetical protein FACS18949_03910 [Clostridia bacterium]